MPGISIHYDIRVACANLIIAQCGVHPLLLDLPPTNVKVRMMPKVGEVVDVLPCVMVAPVEHIPWSPLGFEGAIDKEYMVEYAIVAASNQDFAANQEMYEGWLEQIGRIVSADFIRMLRSTNPPCESVWNCMIDHEATFDRSKLAQNYAYQSILGVYNSQETWS